MNVACTVTQIKDQLKQLSESLETCDQLHQLETTRSKSKGCSYRVAVKNILTAMRKRIKRRSNKKGCKKRKDCRHKVNGGAGRKDNRHKVNGGAGRKDNRSKVNGGAGRKDNRNVIRGGIGRPEINTPSAGSVNPTESQSPTGTSQCNELRDFWWNHSSDAAVLASCCASHEAAMHTFWSVEEWMLHIASATTGIYIIHLHLCRDTIFTHYARRNLVTHADCSTLSYKPIQPHVM